MQCINYMEPDLTKYDDPQIGMSSLSAFRYTSQSTPSSDCCLMRYHRLYDQSASYMSCDMMAKWVDRSTYSMSDAKSFNYLEQGTTKSLPIVSIVELCESEKGAVHFPYTRMWFLDPVPSYCKVPVSIWCLPCITCQANFSGNSIALNSKISKIDLPHCGRIADNTHKSVSWGVLSAFWTSPLSRLVLPCDWGLLHPW